MLGNNFLHPTPPHPFSLLPAQGPARPACASPLARTQSWPAAASQPSLLAPGLQAQRGVAAPEYQPCERCTLRTAQPALDADVVVDAPARDVQLPVHLRVKVPVPDAHVEQEPGQEHRAPDGEAHRGAPRVFAKHGVSSAYKVRPEQPDIHQPQEGQEDEPRIE
eukprot:CAMPEP_0202869072 /NCGR_PEP_ID=MMETSP1391-20130828/11783_1 /ASSEMBLY_ACC=CAM_ASM_000867 /TAXON_ID=1034604 /ORGANISM="Chlamydomonas leiostraca, Strain SAG 11-49" /LENGTH=163 /DNA_ID=CAMNT_0049549327 /DNA_START=281 /DNA_END=773 /DNA_ORIENTATION=+